MQLSANEEVYVVCAVLDNLDPEEDSHIADSIIASLIETGLLDAEAAPSALQAWQDQPDGDQVFDDIRAIYGVY